MESPKKLSGQDRALIAQLLVHLVVGLAVIGGTDWMLGVLVKLGKRAEEALADRPIS